MNKAKAIFAAGIIVVVASASVALWHLNDRGIIGTDGTTMNADGYENVEQDNEQKNEYPQKNEMTETQTPTDNETEVTETEINDFLSVFSRVYFAEQGKPFDVNKYSDYELILFAFLHIKCTDKSLITLEQRDDSIMYYNGISAEKVNEVLNKYFDLSVDEQSVYTENDYAFFSYSDGYFYTPAADGISYTNTAVVSSVETENDYITAKFTVFSGEDRYAHGEAKIQMENGSMKLAYYSIDK